MVCHAALKSLNSRFAAVACAVALVAASVSFETCAQSPAAGWRPQAQSAPYAVRSGDTLDKIIAQHFSGAPFTLPFLRDAIARFNPQSLPQGARGTLLAGTVLRLPDACQLRQLAFGEPGDCGTSLNSGAAPGQAALSAHERAEIERRSWVRYP